LILDIDGVLWRGENPIGNLKRIFSNVTESGINYCFVTNNSSKSTSEYIKKFKKFRVPISKDQIFTSGQVTADILEKRYPAGGNVFIIGMEGLVRTLRKRGFKNSDKDPIAVVVGLDKNVTYKKLRTATLLIHQGVPFIGTNGDMTFPAPEGLAPGAGSLLAALVASTNIEPEIIGKPHSTLFLHALGFLGICPEDALVIGDRLETDIAGGQSVGCKTALVLSGVSTRAMAEEWDPPPDIITENLNSIIERLLQ
jgi:4-nitrophenyl phosphatase